MNIYYLSVSKIPSREANSIHAMNMCNAFANEGHNVTLVIPKNKSINTEITDVFSFYGIGNRFKIVKFPWYKYRYSFYLNNLLLAIWLSFHRKDLVYTRYPYFGTFSTFFGNKTIFEFHQPLDLNSLGLKYKIFKRVFNSKHLLRVVLITKALKEIFINCKPSILENKLFVAHDASNTPTMKAFDFNNNKINVGYVGHLYKGRGINIVCGLAKLYPKILFHIIGGNDKDVKYWKIKSINVKNIIFHGFMSPPNAESYRLGFDILLAPYQKDLSIAGGGKSTSSFMSPLKIFEYMSASKPMIVSDLPVLREVLKDRYNALLVKPNSVLEWENALKTLIQNKELRLILGQNALK